MWYRLTLSRVLIPLALTASLGACGGSRNARVAPPPVPTRPAATPTVAPTATATPDPDVGEEVPDIKDDGVTTVETGDTGKNFHMIFPAETEDGEGRYLEEYLLAVRATSDSCIRLKARPTSGMTESSPIQEDTSDSGCGAGNVVVTPVPVQTPTPQPNAGAGLALSLLNFNGKVAQLAAATPALCSKRLFRMPNKVIRTATEPLAVPMGLDDVVPKTGQLTVVSTNGKIRVWVDEEVGSFCTSGTVKASINNIPFVSSGSTADRDIIFKQHIENLANESEKILAQMQTLYGTVSDVDGNAAVDLFISPDVNRQFFWKTSALHRGIDVFETEFFQKYQDLATYSPDRNPISNEGEIVYLWSPDPAGIYRYYNYPSGNGLASNYAKGYVAAQLMQLIIANNKLFTQKTAPEARFLNNALAFLAADYFAGNDFTFLMKAMFLASRTQEIGLVNPPGASEVDADNYHSWQGFHAMFGWYLHSKLCDPSTVAPCAALKNLFDRKTTGMESVEAVLNLKRKDILAELATSLGIFLSPDPSATLATFQKQAGVNVTIPPLYSYITEVLKDDPRVTAEALVNASGLVGGSAIDRTLAGAVPSRTNLLYQPLLPDHEMDIKLKKDSITLVYLTGLISPTTDVTAWVGPNTLIAIVPTGPRDQKYRQVYREKLSEAAHIDLRPTNLTSTAATPRTTYFTAPEHDGALDFQVTATRELWIVGSIDNTKVNLGESYETVGDTDSFNIEIDPCADAGDAGAIAACRATGTAQILAQVYALDHDKELEPMMALTSTDLSIFEGFSVYRNIKDFDPDFKEPTDPIEGIGMHYLACESGAIADNDRDSANRVTCANGRALPAAYQPEACPPARQATGECALTDRLVRQAAVYNRSVWETTTYFGVVFDNFFYSALGFPFLNSSTFYELGNETRPIGTRVFSKEEVSRQFFNWNLQPKLTLNVMSFYAVFGHANSPAITPVMQEKEIKYLSPSQIDNLMTIQDYANRGAAQDEGLLVACGTLEIVDSVCRGDGGGAGDLSNACIMKSMARNYLLRNELNLKCSALSDTATPDLTCYGFALTQASGGCTNSIVPPDRFVARAWTPSETLQTFYVPTGVGRDPSSDRCNGQTAEADRSVLMDELCANNPVAGPMPDDFRAQLAIPSSELRYGCDELLYPRDFKVCIDLLSYWQLVVSKSLPTDTEPPYWTLPGKSDIERNRVREYPWPRIGEVIGFPRRIHPILFQLDTAGPTIAHFMLGGQNKSQGKYVLRVRVIDRKFTSTLAP